MTDTAQSVSDNLSEKIRTVLADGATASLVTFVEGSESTGAKLLVTADGSHDGDLGNDELNRAAASEAAKFLNTRHDARMLRVGEFAPELKSLAEAQLLFERIEAEPRLVIAGAGHVGASLARLAALVGYRVTLIDDRAEFVTRALFSAPSEQAIDLIAADNWTDRLRYAVGNGRGVSVAIVTRGHKQDEDCLRAITSANPDYVGMIGSKRRTNIVLEKLREEGFDPDALMKVRAPIGLDIGAVSPEEVALAILAEIVAERRGGGGAPLSSWRRT